MVLIIVTEYSSSIHTEIERRKLLCDCSDGGFRARWEPTYIKFIRICILLLLLLLMQFFLSVDGFRHFFWYLFPFCCKGLNICCTSCPKVCWFSSVHGWISPWKASWIRPLYQLSRNVNIFLDLNNTIFLMIHCTENYQKGKKKSHNFLF